MLRFILCALLFGLPLSALFGQATVSGTVTDAETGEALIGAAVMLRGSSEGTVTDFDGKYTIAIPADGEFVLVFSYIGYEGMEEAIFIDDVDITVDIQMAGSQVLEEILVTADIAIDRETPVAFSNISLKKLQEELASQDLPMILNSTPGAYATQSGGGDGDARVTIRGFNQRNVAVMLDGVPVNDMENGQVYWSNWFGLDLMTQTMQVQRGLGASKLAIPSVGGTINILTKGIDAKRGVSFQQELSTNNIFRSTLSVTSGRMRGGWGISAAASYKQGVGYVDQTTTQGFFYFLRIDKALGKHFLTASAFGAPQNHGQRPFTIALGTFDTTYARELGVEGNFSSFSNFGRQFNPRWGYLERNTVVDGDTILANKREEFNTAKNYYHKPQITLRHSWDINRKLFLSNVAYLSLGNGGGTGTVGSFAADSTGQLDVQAAYNANVYPNFLNPDQRARNIIRASVNNHFWYGLLSTMKYEISKRFTFSGGIDLRSYKGSHYREVYDLFGGTYFAPAGNDTRNARIDEGSIAGVPVTKLQEGDKYLYNYDGFVRWGGLFGLLEYKTEKLSAFVNVSGAVTAYKYVDYMFAKELTLPSGTYFVSNVNTGENVPIQERVHIENGVLYTVDNPSAPIYAYAQANNLTIDSTSAQNQEVGWIQRPSYTFKTGLNYNLNDRMNVFFNAGYLSRATRFNNIVDDYYRQRSVSGGQATPELGRILEFTNAENEIITAVEAGYSYKSPIISANLNSYYTLWNNKPLDFLVLVTPPGADPSDPDAREPVNINGLGARHAGLELDFAVKPLKWLTVEGLASYGDWIWNTEATYTFPDDTTQLRFNPKGVKVGDAAQIQLGGLLVFEPIEGLYFKVRGTYFDKNYANFSPEELTDDNEGRQSWKMPSYFLMDVMAGYSRNINKVRLGVRFNLLNALDTLFISDASNNEFGNGFDATSAGVFLGLGRRFNTAFYIQF